MASLSFRAVKQTPGAAAGDELSERLEGGIDASLANGWSVGGEAFYDGLGADDFTAYGGSLAVSVPFN